MTNTPTNNQEIEVVIQDGDGNILADVLMLKNGKIQKTPNDYDAKLVAAAINGAVKVAEQLKESE